MSHFQRPSRTLPPIRRKRFPGGVRERCLTSTTTTTSSQEVFIIHNVYFGATLRNSTWSNIQNARWRIRSRSRQFSPETTQQPREQHKIGRKKCGTIRCIRSIATSGESQVGILCVRNDDLIYSMWDFLCSFFVFPSKSILRQNIYSEEMVFWEICQLPATFGHRGALEAEPNKRKKKEEINNGEILRNGTLWGFWLDRVHLPGPQDKFDVIALLGFHRLRGRLEQTPWAVAHVVTVRAGPFRVARARVVLVLPTAWRRRVDKTISLIKQKQFIFIGFYSKFLAICQKIFTALIKKS